MVYGIYDNAINVGYIFGEKTRKLVLYKPDL